MNFKYVKECILSLKVNNSADFDCIPQCVLIDRLDHLLKPISELMNLIYLNKQWLVAKVIQIIFDKINTNINQIV
jgi:hypothetical protein